MAAGVFLGTRFDWDDLSYHAPAVAHWLVDGRLSLAPFWYQAYYPLAAGCKVSFVPVSAALMAWVAYRSRGDG